MRLLNLVDPDQGRGEFTGVGPLVLARHSLSFVGPGEVQQRFPGDGSGVDALCQDGAQVIALGAVGAGSLVELGGVLDGEFRRGRLLVAVQTGVRYSISVVLVEFSLFGAGSLGVIPVKRRSSAPID